MNFISCLAWVPKGKAKSCPDKLEISPEELKQIIEETKESISTSQGEQDVEDDFDEGSSIVKKENLDNSYQDSKRKIKSEFDKKDSVDSDEDFNTRYNLDAYDSEEENPIIKLKDIAVYVDNKDDEYITNYEAVKEDEEEENENFTIKDSDNLLIVGHVENDCSVLEIYVYNEKDGDFYVHHDIVLPSYPLALEWLDFDPNEEKPGSFVAVADMTPVIKIWDLDVVEVMEPDFCLGKEQKKLKNPKKKKFKYHSDAVLSLSWNKEVRNVLASGSADSTIILWDLSEGTVLHKIEFHTNKVQSLQWHPSDSSLLLSGCMDGSLKVFNCLHPNEEYKSWPVDGEIERAIWHLTDSKKCLCSTDKGFVYSFDLEKDLAIHEMQVSEEAVTGLDINPANPKILMTASTDETVSAWDIDSMKMIKTKELKVGSIHVAKFAPDAGLTLAVGGNDASNNLKVYHLAEEKLEDSDENNDKSDADDDLQQDSDSELEGKGNQDNIKKTSANASSGGIKGGILKIKSHQFEHSVGQNQKFKKNQSQKFNNFSRESKGGIMKKKSHQFEQSAKPFQEVEQGQKFKKHQSQTESDHRGIKKFKKSYSQFGEVKKEFPSHSNKEKKATHIIYE